MSDSTKKYLLRGGAVVLGLLLLYIIYTARGIPVTILNPTSTTTPTIKIPKFTYIEIVDSCDTEFGGEPCVNLREGPGTNYPVAFRLRNGVVLRVGEKVAKDGEDWYKIIFSSELAYPERIKGDLYVSADLVNVFSNAGDILTEETGDATTTKRIIVDVSEQKLYAYDKDKLFMEEPISTGLEFTPTPRGKFSVFKMTPSRFMQGPIKGVSDQVYDLPGVPWNLYFTAEGAVIHGAYWHDNFGEKWSHGCVNLSPENAKKLYDWAEIGMKVIVQN